jgi:hypothetical protein
MLRSRDIVMLCIVLDKSTRKRESVASSGGWARINFEASEPLCYWFRMTSSSPCSLGDTDPHYSEHGMAPNLLAKIVLSYFRACLLAGLLAVGRSMLLQDESSFKKANY